MADSQPDRAALDWAHNYLAGHLDEIGRRIPRLPRLTVIARDPDLPERHVIVTNEPEDVERRLEGIVRVPARVAVTPEAVIVAAARAFVRAWAETGRGSVLLPECVEGHAFDLVRAVHAAYPPASDPHSPSAPKPHGGDDPPDLTRLWNDAEAIYEREFPEPRHYFGMLPSLAKIAYFEQASIEAIERAMGAPHTVRARVVSVEEMKRYLHAAVPTEITDG